MIPDSVARAAPWSYPNHPANAGNRARLAALVFNLEAPALRGIRAMIDRARLANQ